MHTPSAAKFSRLGLGTVQWGLRYGVANTAGQPTPDEVERMLRVAAECGVNWLDTARAYGESEQVIGSVLGKAGLGDAFHVVTKICHVTPVCRGPVSAVRRLVEESVEASMKALGVARIPTLLVHNGLDIQIAGVWDELLRQKEKGKVGRLGVSVSHSPVETVERALELEGMEAVQVAVNVFDRRLLRAGTLSKLAERGVAVFVRSVYLQGLIIMPEGSVPEHLRSSRPYRRMVAERAEAWRRDLREVAVQFVLGLPGVTSVVIGCETEEQVRDNARLVASPPLTEEQMGALAAMPEVPLEICEPWHWEGSMKPPQGGPRS